MSLHSYHVSKKLLKNDPPFYAIILAAMRKADTDNLARLKNAWPGVYAELDARYNAPMGLLPEDGPVDKDTLKRQIRDLNGDGDDRPVVNIQGTEIEF